MALRRIVLRDFVIVGELELDLSSGFTVLTGETGAGKSILIDALQLVTGARADAGTVREGASRTDVSAEFDAPANLSDWLDQAGFDSNDTLLLRRTVDLQGKSRGWINGSPATATQLRELGEQLIDIHGQHAWQSLTRAESVRDLLDAYARLDLKPLAALWQRWRTSHKALTDARAAQANVQRERERISWQIGELDKLSPGDGEWDELNTEHSRLSNAQALLEAAQSAVDGLQDAEPSAADALQGALNQLRQQEQHEPAFAAMAEQLESSLAQLEDVVHDLKAYLRKTEPDPQRLSQLDARMALWISLARRYKSAPQDMAALLGSWREELTRLDAASDLEGLQANEQATHAAYQREAKLVSKARTKVAPLLAKAITQAMQGLGMEGGRFEVQLQPADNPMQTGLEDIVFLVAGHAGSTPRAVAKVASGGELSRMALAIAVTTSELGTAQTLIFDEIDSGVGGAVAQTVGRLMRQLGIDRQVLAVTHLPQVAACADHHLVVTKKLHGKSTLSAVGLVQGEARVAEIARMLGGEHLMETTVAHAKEMLQSS
ncbi:MAG: DNA repair protein RecN [Rhodoferax sp.]|nr:DNA repair protein RecN [Rhodoferax sp.]HQZ07319.1 DNA repair protein RecN [Burkholderiaceae bacterium]HRA62579.1 DNA repair protein RecN [Burkholderiaceae bacterium]